MNQKVLMGVIAVLVLLILAGGGFFVISRMQAAKLQAQQQSQDDQGQQIQVAGNLQPADIGLQMELNDAKNKVRFTADKLDGVKSIEWNFSYDADIPASEQTPDNKGMKVTNEFGSDEPVVLNGKTSYQSEFRELGTCSRNVCRYDTGVTSVKLVMKVTKNDGKVYQVNDSINL